MLAQISSSTLDALPKELEPSSLVLDDGVDATSLIGAEVRRKFPSGWFNGRVVQVFPDPNYPDVLLFKVVYEDNDDEVMTYESLTKILVNRAFSAASYASTDPAFATHSKIQGFDFPTPFTPFGEFDALMHDPDFLGEAIAASAFLTAVSDQVFMAAAATRRYKSITAEEIRAGKQYTWHHVLKHMSKADRALHIEAMNEEIRKLVKAGHARRHRNLPEHISPENVFHPVGVFKQKTHDMHTQGGHNLKGRICLDGGGHEGGWETSANVATTCQILMIFAIAVAFGDKLMQLDVKSAFTQVKLAKGQTIWLRPLPGFPDTDKEGLYLELLHYLYGHPEANHAWQWYWVKLVHSYGFKSADRAGTVFNYTNCKSYMRWLPSLSIL
jgi:hypothetical protein